MEETRKIRWCQWKIPRRVVISGISLSLIAFLVAVFPWRAQRRRDRSGWEHLSWQYVPGQNGAEIFSAHLKRRSEEVTLQLVAFFPKDFDFLVLDNGASRATPRYRDLRDAMQSRGCVAGVNGGFFNPVSFKPNGLMISDGTATGEYDPENWAKGVVFVRNGELALQDSADLRPVGKITQLLRTGPWLVRDGSQHARFEEDHPAPRTFLAEGRSGKWILGHSSAITLQGLSGMLGGTTFGRVLVGETKNAVNLDGGPSSGFWAAVSGGGEVHLPEQTIIRNYIGLRSKSKPANHVTAPALY